VKVQSFLVNEEGFLEVTKNGRTVLQRCPHRNDTSCGIWCPLFGVVEHRTDRLYELVICRRTIVSPEAKVMNGTILDEVNGDDEDGEDLFWEE